VQELNTLGSLNPTALEIEGLLEARQGKYDEALETFARAAEAYQNRPEVFRCILHQAELLQSLEREAELAELIKKALLNFTDATSKRILRSYGQSKP
jgi:tetratricopeptide (TPR) repeat protein